MKEDPRWTDTKLGFPEGGRDNLAIAMALYNVGGGTVESLTEDWALSPDDSAELMRLVRDAWAEGRWADRRAQRERRTP